MSAQNNAPKHQKGPIEFRKVLAIAALCTAIVVALLLVFPTLGTYVIYLANVLLNSAGSYLPFIPLLLYAVVGYIVRTHLSNTPNRALADSLDKEQGSSLTLAGFSFAVLSLLLPYFKQEIKAGDAGPAAILKYFAIALGCFVAGFMTLRYRGRNLFKFSAEAFLDNGLWCVFAGFWAFFNSEPALARLSVVITGVIVIYSLYLALNFSYIIGTYRKAVRET